ncbi:Glycosyl transferase family 2 [Pseudobutyrivibrio sp. 49]|uniref:glycosyltransferase family 2 protein n=1 Tax=Pseudobutyrivibrio sp. 49 TaxID=1855344 RepID=UPI00088BCF95|nr:glycosyltransferase family 2 protein [Pseudobutyrivibrio sp. 49]SDH60709.1 Glycosyl transferase family 2 [Pseudobutyrivibrio sp. 49]
MKKLLVVIPAYNEAENIARVVEQLQNEYAQFDYIVVNDGSIDNTAEICKKNGYNMIDLPVNLGLSGAFQTGMRYALKKDYDYAIQYDGDGQHNPEFLDPMMQYAEDNKLDIVIGSRFLEGDKRMSFRMFGNSLIDALIKITTGKTVKDSTSGMRMYDKKMIKKLAYQMNYGPEPDTIAYLIRCGAKVGEYPVKMNERIAGESYLSFTNGVKYMFHMITSILVVQWFRKKG